MNEQSLFVTIDDSLGVGLSITTSKHGENREETEEQKYWRAHNADRISVPNDPNMLAYVVAEIIREHPEYSPQIEVRGQIDREQFFHAYRTQTGQNLKGVLDS